MKKSILTMVSLLVLLSMMMAGCQSAQPAPADTQEEAAAPAEAAEEQTAEEAPAELTEVTIVGDWPTPWVGWIPWLVAQEKGFYEEAGLKVNTVVPATVADPPKYVALGKADFAYTTQLDVILGRAAGIPIVSTAAVFRYNNWGLIFPQDSAVQSLSDIKTLALYENTWDHSCFKAMMAHEGLSMDDVNILPATSDVVPLMLAGKVDAMGGITNAEQTEAKITGQIETNMLMARDYGVPDVYVYLFASSNQFLDENPELAKKFMAATMKGLQYSVENPDESLAIFKELYPDALSDEYAQASWDATIPVFETDTYGYQDPALWEEVQNFMKENEIIEETVPVEQLFTNDFIAE